MARNKLSNNKLHVTTFIGGPYHGQKVGLRDPLVSTLTFTACGMTGRYVNSHWEKA